MFKKYQLKIASVVALFVTFFNTQVTFAATSVWSKYDLDSYQSIVTAKSAWHWVDNNILGIQNTITNMGYSVNKMVWDGFDTVIYYVMKANIFNDYADTIGNISKTMYDHLFKSVGLLLVVIAVVFIAYLFIFGSPEKAFKQFLLMGMVLTFSTVWFSQSGYFMKVINGVTTELQADVMSAGSINGGQLVETADTGDSMKNATNALRTSYFEMSVSEPYYLMNYGTAKIDEAKKHTQDGDVGEFLAKDFTEKSKEDIATAIGNIKDDGLKKNEYLSPDQLPYKMAIAWLSVFSTVFFGVIQALIAVMNLVIQFGAVLIDLILPIMAILSLLPRFNNLFYGGIKGMVMILLSKSVLGVVMLGFRFILVAVDGIVPRTSVGLYMGNAFLKTLIIVMLYAFRKPIGSFIKHLVVDNVVRVAKERTPEFIKQPYHNSKNERSTEVTLPQLPVQQEVGEAALLAGLRTSLDNLADKIDNQPDYQEEQAKPIQDYQEEQQDEHKALDDDNPTVKEIEDVSDENEPDDIQEIPDGGNQETPVEPTVEQLDDVPTDEVLPEQNAPKSEHIDDIQDIPTSKENDVQVDVDTPDITKEFIEDNQQFYTDPQNQNVSNIQCLSEYNNLTAAPMVNNQSSLDDTIPPTVNNTPPIDFEEALKHLREA